MKIGAVSRPAPAPSTSSAAGYSTSELPASLRAHVERELAWRKGSAERAVGSTTRLYLESTGSTGAGRCRSTLRGGWSRRA